MNTKLKRIWPILALMVTQGSAWGWWTQVPDHGVAIEVEDAQDVAHVRGESARLCAELKWVHRHSDAQALVAASESLRLSKKLSLRTSRVSRMPSLS